MLCSPHVPSAWRRDKFRVTSSSWPADPYTQVKLPPLVPPTYPRGCWVGRLNIERCCCSRTQSGAPPLGQKEGSSAKEMSFLISDPPNPSGQGEAGPQRGNRKSEEAAQGEAPLRPAGRCQGRAVPRAPPRPRAQPAETPSGPQPCPAERGEGGHQSPAQDISGGAGPQALGRGQKWPSGPHFPARCSFQRTPLGGCGSYFK